MENVETAKQEVNTDTDYIQKIQSWRESHHHQSPSGAQPEIFQGRGSFMKLGHSDKHFVSKIPEKRARRENFFS